MMTGDDERGFEATDASAAHQSRLTIETAHALNNPLAYVLHNLELIERELGGVRKPDAARLSELASIAHDAWIGADRIRVAVRELSLPEPNRSGVRPQAPRPRLGAPARKQTARRGRVLVIDDEPVMGRAIQRTLGQDHDVMAVGSGIDALSLFDKGERFDVVLCDLAMPSPSGADVFRAVRKVDPSLASRFVFMSGGTFLPDAERFLSEVENPHLDKPFDIDQLRALIRAMVM